MLQKTNFSRVKLLFVSLVTPFYSSHIVSDMSNDDPEQNGGQITFVLRSQSSKDPTVDGLSPELLST